MATKAGYESYYSYYSITWLWN